MSMQVQSTEEIDVYFLGKAIEQAELALQSGEVPVGCVFVEQTDQGNHRIVSSGYNKTNETRNGTRHAELVAIDKIVLLPDIDENVLQKCTLYVSCEPCIMCAAAIAKVGIKRVCFGCHNDRFGGNGSILAIHNSKDLSTHSYDVVSGVLQDRAIELFQRFYESENRRAPESKRRRKNGQS